MSRDRFTLTFRGVRGGHPMPGPTTVRYGGNTTCMEVWAGDHLIIVDAGTGAIQLGQEMVDRYYENGDPIRATLLFTHLHHDHTQGLPFFKPLIHPQATLYVFGPKPSEMSTLEEDLTHDIQPPVFPIGLEDLYSKRVFHHIRGKDMIVLRGPDDSPQALGVHDDREKIPPDAVVIKVHHGYNHPQIGVLIFRITYRERSIVIATDTEGYAGGDRKLIKFAQGSDLLVHDAEYDLHEYADQPLIRQGWGHSTWMMAAEVAQAAGVKKLALFHHSASHDDDYLDEMERKTQEVFPETLMAREGLVLSVL